MTAVETLIDQASRARSLAERCPSLSIAMVLMDYARDCEASACELVAALDRSKLH